MKTRLMLFASALATMLFCLPAIAQPGPGGSTMGAPNPGTTTMKRNCSEMTNPAACEARQAARAKAFEACNDKAGNERRQCMREQRMAGTDCSKSRNPQQCEARKQAYQACRGQAQSKLRQCMAERMPPVDCSKAPNPQRCEQHQKARMACQDKAGPEHMACLRAQFGVK